MTREEPTCALVGAVGGAGTTRLTLEGAATLARAGRHVAVLDVAVGTQGLAGSVPGRIEPDLARVLIEDGLTLADAMVDLALDVPGRLSVAPVRAPFERFASAQTAGAAARFADLLTTAGGQFDHVLVDVPPVDTNLAVAAVTAADRVTIVAPPGVRGADGVQRVRCRLADVGAPTPTVVVNEGVRDAGDDRTTDADATVPASDVRAPGAVPSVVDPDATFAPSVAAATEAITGTALDLSFPGGGLLDGVR